MSLRSLSRKLARRIYEKLSRRKKSGHGARAPKVSLRKKTCCPSSKLFSTVLSSHLCAEPLDLRATPVAGGDFAASAFSGDIILTGNLNSTNLQLSTSGGNLAHNLVGYNSSTDWDAITGGDQTIPVAGITSLTINAGDGADVVDLSAISLPAVTLNGEGGSDSLIGSAGNDFINGGASPDSLDGGPGGDSLDGGAGQDEFFFGGTVLNGVIDWWKGEVDASDSGFNNQDGVEMNGVSHTTGYRGQAFSFDGTDDFVQLPNNFFVQPGNSFPSTGAFTFSTWFNTTSGGVIFGQQSSAAPPGGCPGSGWVPGLYVDTSGFLRAEMFWFGSVSPFVSSSTVNDGNWHNVTVTYDGATETAYLDGASFGTGARTQTAYGATYYYELGVGCSNGWPGGNGGWYYFNGEIDEVQLYNRSLSSGEVSSLANPSLGNDTIADASNADPDILDFSGINDGLDVTVTDGGVTVVGSVFNASFSNSQSIGRIDGGLGDDNLTVDFTGANPVPSAGLTFNGGVGGNDSLTLDGGVWNTITFNYTNTNDGNVVLNDGASTTVNYTGLEPILNTGTATDIILNLPATADDAKLSDIGGGLLRLESQNATFETTDFTAPTGSLTINAGDGNDTIDAGSLGYQAFDLVLNGDGDNDTIYGSVNSDSISGGAGYDTIDGNWGADTIYGGANDDTIDGGDGNDSIDGGSGYDTIDGGYDNDTVYGGTQDDTINGTNGNDSLDGGAGYDTISGGWGYDTIYGGTQDDTISGGDSDDSLDGGAGYDTISGGWGYDTIYGGTQDDTISGGDDNDSLDGGSGYDTISGGWGYDTIFGGADDDTIDGGDDDDSIDGGAGNDTIDGDYGDDTIYGGLDDDTIDGDDGDDSLDGGSGNDTIRGGDDYDTVFGGDGNDSIRGNDESDSVMGGIGDDTIHDGWDGSGDTLDGGDGNDSIISYDGDDSMIGGSGNDTLFVYSWYCSENTISGGDGDDTIYAGDCDDSVDGGAGDDTIDGGWGYDTVYGGADNDTIFGNFGDDSIDGGSGNDTINGGNNSDIVYGGSGNDTIYDGFDSADDTLDGGAGNDYVYSYDGNDSMVGGDGNDTLYVYWWNCNENTIFGGDGDDTIDAGDCDDSIDGGAGNDTIDADDGDDTVYGGLDDDTIDGDDDDDSIDGGAGNDTIDGDDEYDTIYGGLGDDTIDGGNESDSIDGGAGNDTIDGDDEYDTIYGGLGDDTIDGGNESDSIDGGAGNDTIDGDDEYDTIYGGLGDDTIDGGNEDDSIDGGAGNDTIEGDDGDDTIYGGADDDTLDGEYGDDTVMGGTGNDTLYGGSGDLDNDTLAGGLGDDSLEADGHYGYVTVYGLHNYWHGGYHGGYHYGNHNQWHYTNPPGYYHGFYHYGIHNQWHSSYHGGYHYGYYDIGPGNYGEDSLVGGDGDDTLYGAEGYDTLAGGADDDTFAFDPWVADNYWNTDYIIEAPGCADSDTIDLRNLWNSADIDIGYVGWQNISGYQSIYLYYDDAIENVLGTYYGDNIYGNDCGNYIYGNDGDDYIYTYYGGDTINGGYGDDTMYACDPGDTYANNFDDSIVDPDNPSFSVNDVTRTEPNAGTTTLTFTITKSGGMFIDTEVTYNVANGIFPNPALVGSDVTANSLLTDTIFFPAGGGNTYTVTVNIVGDTMFELDEQFFINLFCSRNASISDGQGIGTILNNDVAPTLSINNVSIAEGNAGTTAYTFTASLTNATYQTVLVDYATANGTASSASDYTSKNGTLIFSPGETTKTVTVLVNGDLTPEGNEVFFVNLYNLHNSTFTDNQGLGTIVNDDAAVAPSISINDVTLAEGNAGTTFFNFTVSLSAGVGTPVTVDYATASGTALSGVDYTANSGTITFAPFVTLVPVTVSVTGDVMFESNEAFYVNLTNAVGASLLDTQGQGTINNDDATPTIAINNVTKLEGNSGTTAFTFTVSLSGPSGTAISVAYATANGTATAGTDYTAAPAGAKLYFNPGQTSKTVTVNVTGDTAVETNETFFVNLSGASGAAISDSQGLGTIVNDDTSGLPKLTISDRTAAEGTVCATTPFSFTVNLSAASASNVTVNYATANGTASSASDYTGIGSTALIFTPGQTSKTVTVNVTCDGGAETNETFFVNLSSAVNATIGDSQGVGTITDDDGGGTPTISINDVTLAEGNAGNTSYTFTVTLSAVNALTTTVDYATVAGSALAGIDYVTNYGTVIFSPGETIKTITILVVGETTSEPDETFTVILSNAHNATILDGSGLGTITNDD